MSGEVETKEEVKEPPRKPLETVLKEQWQLAFKIVELLLSAVCMGFIYEPAVLTGLGKSHFLYVGIMYTAYTGFIVVNSVLIIGRALGDKIPYRTVTLFSLVGAALFLITCILLATQRFYLTSHYFYHPHQYLLTMMTTSIGFAFLNAGIYAVDAIATFIKKADF